MYLLNTKICRRCKKVKSLTEFYLRAKYPLLYAFCKTCMKRTERKLADEDYKINSLVSCRDTETDVGQPGL